MHNKKWLISALFLLVAVFLFTAIKRKPNTPYKPESITEAPARVPLTNKHSSLPALAPMDSMVNRVMRNLRIEGATVALVKDERLVYAKGFGYADKENKVKVEPYHRFRIGSVSKLITAIAVLKLVDEGKLSLDDYVFGEKGILKGKPYDKIQNRNVYQIKVKHLLNHTGGWSLITYGDPMFIPHKIHKMDKVSYPIEFDDVVRFVLTRHLPYRPGTRFDYSNFGYCLLGRVIEEVTGDDYEEWVIDHILEPNGIKNMAIAGNFEKDRKKNEVKYYDYSVDNQQLSFTGSGKMVYKPYGADDIEMLGPAGGWLANSVDLMRVLVLVDGYSRRYKDILSKDLINKMVNGVGGINQPLGWRSTRGEHWWRTGTLSGTSALLTRDEKGYSWVIVANTTPRRGSFPGTSRWAIREGIKLVKSWPSHDLFEVSE
ncbi:MULTISPECIES: serine hydrolase domain-containing protein [Roseivirga]|jgi:CubicO group peptidase (beta-lactamase class C family)|nr:MULTISPECIES: serine hydrolase domain-containing protein [Roseivirga]MEC7752939.1 serine hydrolase domain-containing protein [Bacteroidota bacterium]|tara:strand:- start:3105 stop:4391 length:1287 start_codon:yes stop_codon:yes gene_type:complete